VKLADYLLQQPLYAYGTQVNQQGSQTTPVQSWQEGLARALQGGVGGFFAGQGMREAKAEQSADSSALADALAKFGKGDMTGATSVLASRPNLSDVAAQIGMQAGMLGYKQKLENDNRDADMARYGMGPPAAGGGNAGPYGGAIAGIESQGQPNGGYGAIGPVANQQGNRAYGKYQVLDSNIPAWTKEILGQEMTPQQFLQSPQAQDAVFKAKFGQYVQQYGSPEAASRAWFAGPGGMNNPGARDANGMTVAQYGNKFSAALGPQQQGGDSVTIQGIPVPRAALFGALQILDQKERQKALAGVLQDAVKRQQEGVPLERVRQADGSEILVPRSSAGGMVSSQNVSPPGSKEGDVDLLTRALQDPQMRRDPAVRAAYDRLAQPQMSQSGQLMYPDMGAWAQLGFGAPTGVQFRDTPNSQFQMSGKLSDDFGGNKVVQQYREVTPIISSMRDAMGRDNKAADLNLIYGAAKLMDPGSVVREGEMLVWKNIQSLPEWMKQTVAGWTQGKSALSPEARSRLMQEIESRYGALQSQYDQLKYSADQKAGRYGLDPRDVTGTPLSQPQQQAPAANVPIYDINGKRVK
jgi:hypothetical protein